MLKQESEPLSMPFKSVEPTLQDKLHFCNQLYDFYGALLTEKQRNCFIMRYLEDYSLTEIGEALQITPQAVADQLKRTAALLQNYEDKLGFIRSWDRQQDYLQQATTLLSALQLPEQQNLVEQIRLLIEEVKNGF